MSFHHNEKEMTVTMMVETMTVVSTMRDHDQLSSGGNMASDMTTSVVMETTTQGDGQTFRFENPVQRIIIGCIYSLVAVVGFSGNFMVILAVILSRKLQTRTNVFVVNLAVADLLFCSTAPFITLSLLSMNGWPLPLIVCSITAALFYTSLACSVMNLALIAINRFILITKTSKTYRSVYTPKKITAMVVFSWGYPAVVACFPLLGIGRWGYSEKYKTCTQDTSSKTTGLFSLLGSVLMYPIPLIILLVCYFKIYRHVTGHMKKMVGKGKGTEIEDTPNSPNTPSTTQLNRNPPPSFSKRQVEITKNLFYVVCAFVACLAPFAINLMIPASDHTIPWTSTIIIFNGIVNPIIYGAKHPHFKEVFRHMLRCRYHMIPEPSGCLRKIRSR
ncbi:alpha-1A adrenergic receptor-like [Acanthaster planci]|uniref:Alpha-1A adrenergic receptor-like n=1 Tax=Acanthaster planci TaxID=133434 RepID=A0A8B7ZIC0_ACAPL|nr:alpha-1A adrenergic receptor-like [Acanthaster planci]XP_022103011.1 alpha-1A adrenergic receptor-like [Acanthaster planci]